MSSSSLSVSSAESNDDVSVSNIEGNETVPESVVATKMPSSKRFRWPSMELRVVKDAHGSKCDSYPFLLDSNEQDKALIRNLLVYRPFLQKKGEQTAAWTNVVEMTFETEMPNGKKVFQKKNQYRCCHQVGQETSRRVRCIYEEIPRDAARLQFGR
jgi:hypothetical protein